MFVIKGAIDGVYGLPLIKLDLQLDIASAIDSFLVEIIAHQTNSEIETSNVLLKALFLIDLRLLYLEVPSLFVHHHRAKLVYCVA